MKDGYIFQNLTDKFYKIVNDYGNLDYIDKEYLLNDLVKCIDNGNIMEWISVKIRLPNNDDEVLVYNPKDGISIGEYDEKTGWETDYYWAPYMSPTHWMPLPPPPPS